MSNLNNLWEEMKVLVDTVEVDVFKNNAGNKAAGVRARKGLRDIKSKAGELVKVSLTADKQSS
jgi:hypothetical protein